jgi:WD40 repeat protein
MASGGGATIILWDLSPDELTTDLGSDSVIGQPISTFTTQPTRGRIVDFSPNGRLLAQGASATISIVDVISGTQVSALTHPTANLIDLKFSPDDIMLASASINGDVVLWDLPTAKPIGPPLASEIGLNSNVAFRPDGQQFALGADDGSVILWDVSQASWQSLACGRANRNLTEEEWRQFFGDEPYRLTCPDLPSGAKGGE